MSQTEFVLFATKGKMLQYIKKRNICQIVESIRENHSKKPDIIRKKIEEMFPNVNKIELFARKKNNGWDVFGNEIKSDIKL